MLLIVIIINFFFFFFLGGGEFVNSNLSFNADQYRTVTSCIVDKGNCYDNNGEHVLMYEGRSTIAVTVSSITCASYYLSYHRNSWREFFSLCHAHSHHFYVNL